MTFLITSMISNKKESSSQYLADLDKIRKAYVQDVKENYSNNSIPDFSEKVNTSDEKIQFSRKAEDVNAKNTVTMSRGDFIHRRWIYSANGGFN